MGSLYIDDPAPRNAYLEAYGQPSLDSGYGLGATSEESYIRSPFSPLMHQQQLEAASGAGMAETGPVLPTEDFVPTVRQADRDRTVLPAEEANKLFGIQGELSFDRPTRRAEAELLNRWKQDELRRRNILQRAQPGIGPGAARLGVSFLVSALDPLNVASAFVPVVGEARFAALAAKVGRTPARLIEGGIEGAVGAAVVEPIVYLQAQNQKADYSAYDSILNIAFGTALGGGLHAGFGKISDLIAGQPIEVRETALRGAVAAVVEDRPVRVAEGITAFHGSPHTFDAFSLKAIGTGEGAQAFGHGLYFAESRNVASIYRETLSAKQMSAPAGKVDIRAEDGMWNVYVDGQLENAFGSKADAERYASRGTLYETRLRVSKDDLLDWDKPLSQQSEKVKAALRKTDKRSPEEKAAIDALAAELGDITDTGSVNTDYSGKQAYQELVDRLGSPEAATAALREAGIPGIQYLDQGSRAAGEGTRNFVIFDDSLVDIVKRNDQPFDQKAALAAQRASQSPSPTEVESVAAINTLTEGFDKPITPETPADEAAELIAATDEAVAMAKREGALTDADEAAIKGDPEVEKALKGRAKGIEAAAACLARMA